MGKITSIVFGLFMAFGTANAIGQCKDIDEAATFDAIQCKSLCKDKKDTDKYVFSESEKGGAFAYKCDCGDPAEDYCLDKKYDASAANDAVTFATLSPWALGATALLGVRNF
jgi:hypothetical protein